jgi:hypothetical protein
MPAAVVAAAMVAAEADEVKRRDVEAVGPLRAAGGARHAAAADCAAADSTRRVATGAWTGLAWTGGHTSQHPGTAQNVQCTSVVVRVLYDLSTVRCARKKYLRPDSAAPKDKKFLYHVLYVLCERECTVRRPRGRRAPAPRAA